MRVLKAEEYEFVFGGRSSGSGGGSRGGSNHGGQGKGGNGHQGGGKGSPGAPGNHKGSNKVHPSNTPAFTHGNEPHNELGINVHRNFDNRDPAKNSFGAEVGYTHSDGNWSVGAKAGGSVDQTGHTEGRGEVNFSYKWH